MHLEKTLHIVALASVLIDTCTYLDQKKSMRYLVLTRQTLPDICDFCGQDITKGMQYRLQYSQKSPKGESKKGEFVKANNQADQCHKCFTEMCKNGYKPDWLKLVKNEQSGKWEAFDPQEKLD